MSWGPENAAAFPDVVDVCLLLCKLYFALVDVAMNEQFSEVFLSPRGKILYTIMMVFKAVLPEGSKVTGIQALVFGLAAESFSESLEYIMYTDDEIPEFLAIERCWTIYSRRCSQSGDPHPIFACEQLSLLWMLLLHLIMTLTFFQL